MVIDYMIILKLFLAVLVGAAIGFERRRAGKPLGILTLSLVSLGATFATILGTIYTPNEVGRVLAGILTGLGFLGAGAIIAEGKNVRGLTTAATIWAVAIVGIGLGFGEFFISLALGIFIFIILLLGKLNVH